MSRAGGGRGGAAGVSPALAAAFLLAALTLWIAPNGFGGGALDDQRYLEAARAWVSAPPLVAETHWELRHTLTLPLAAWFAIAGESLAPFHLLPAFAWLLLLGISMAGLARFAGEAPAIVFAGLFATTQLFHQFGTRFYPEIFELLFVAASLWSFYLGAQAEAGRRWLVGAGVAAALAMLTRETSWYLPLLYAGLFVTGRPVPRAKLLWVAVGAVPLLAAETLWLWAATGDPLHRAHVALNHVKVPTDQMEGLVYEGAGGVLFNPEIGARWKDVGTFDVHWTVNPLLNLFADIRYGLLFWLVGGLWILGRGGRREAAFPLGAILAVGLLSFAFANYVLMLPQRTRYYGFLAYAATIDGAILADRVLLKRGRRKLFGLAAAVQLVAGFLLVSTLRRDEALADVAVPLIASVREPVYADAATLAQLSFPLDIADQRHKVIAGAAPPGALALQVLKGGHGAAPAEVCCWRQEAAAAAPAPLPAKVGRLLGLVPANKPPALSVRLVRRVGMQHRE